MPKASLCELDANQAWALRAYLATVPGDPDEDWARRRLGDVLRTMGVDDSDEAITDLELSALIDGWLLHPSRNAAWGIIGLETLPEPAS